MSPWLLKRIRSNPLLYSILRDESYQYKYLLEDETYVYQLERRAKEKYKMRFNDKLDRLEKRLSLIQALMSALD